MKPGDRCRWLQPTVGTVTEIHEKTGYFSVNFDGQKDSWSFDLDEAAGDFEFWPSKSGRHAKPRKRWWQR
jgi:hypothetical protein